MATQTVSITSLEAAAGVELDSPADGKTTFNTPVPSLRKVQVPTGMTRDRYIKEGACVFQSIILGWQDASSGPQIPYIQAYYGLTYTVGKYGVLSSCRSVKLMITSTAIKMVGFAFAGFANTHLTHKLGLGRVTTIGALVQAFGYIFLIPAFPFPIMPVVYGVLGFGMALQGAACNTYVATLPNPQQHFGFVHAAYGIGALVCPLAVTGWASAGHKFSYFYAVSLGLSCLNVAICLGAFRFNYRIEDTHAELDGQKAGHEDVELDEVSGGRVTGSEGGVVEKQGRERGALETVLRMRIMWVFCLFILVYVGAEVSTGGWIVTFVIDERNGGPSAGYVASGYWGGLALGRLVLARVNVALGEKRSVFYYLSIVVGLELAIWFAHNLVANAVTVALVGFLIGPLYPNACSIATKVIPRHLHNSTLGFIGAFGQVGSAVFPFMTGALAQKYSTYALQPMMIVLSVVMMSVWWFVPEPPKKDE